MNEGFAQDSLKVAEKALSQSIENSDSFNIWIWVAIGEFVIILLFIFSKLRKKKGSLRRRFKEEALKENIDFNNIIKSSFHSNELYNKLKVKCHPDRFPNDPELNSIADGIFQEITKNKTNIKRLEELKNEAHQKLNINF